jgi:hypothetical protein
MSIVGQRRSIPGNRQRTLPDPSPSVGNDRSTAIAPSFPNRIAGSAIPQGGDSRPPADNESPMKGTCISLHLLV